MGKAKTRYVKSHYKEVKVRRDFYEELRRLASEKGLSVPALIEELFKRHTGASISAHTGASIPAHTGASMADCVARRARKGDKQLNAYFLECKDGAKAVVPEETLADLSNRFKLKITIVEG